MKELKNNQHITFILTKWKGAEWRGKKKQNNLNLIYNFIMWITFE